MSEYQTEENMRLGNNYVWGANRAQIDIHHPSMESGEECPSKLLICAPNALKEPYRGPFERIWKDIYRYSSSFEASETAASSTH
eukprot:scaffold23973_cov78-Skeletonema_dohrnii-CCMP3373.AAC.1